MESIKGADIWHQTRPLALEDLPDRAVSKPLMRMRFGPSNAAVLEPGVEFGVALKLGPGHEEAPTDNADLDLDLPFLPAKQFDNADVSTSATAAEFM